MGAPEAPEKKKRERHNCCVPQCHNVLAENVHLHQVPKDESERHKWSVAIKTGKKLGEKMTVCSQHFLETNYIKTCGTGKKRRLKPGSVPSQNLPKRTHDKVITSPLKRKREMRQQRASKRAARSNKSMSDESLSGLDRIVSSNSNIF